MKNKLNNQIPTKELARLTELAVLRAIKKQQLIKDGFAQVKSKKAIEFSQGALGNWHPDQVRDFGKILIIHCDATLNAGSSWVALWNSTKTLWWYWPLDTIKN